MLVLPPLSNAVSQSLGNQDLSLAAPALRVFTRVASAWSLTVQEQSAILGRPVDVACSQLDAGRWIATGLRRSRESALFSASMPHYTRSFPISSKQTAGYAAQMQGHPSRASQRWRSCATAGLATWRSFVSIWTAKGRTIRHRPRLMLRSYAVRQSATARNDCSISQTGMKVLICRVIRKPSSLIR